MKDVARGSRSTLPIRPEQVDSSFVHSIRFIDDHDPRRCGGPVRSHRTNSSEKASAWSEHRKRSQNGSSASSQTIRGNQGIPTVDAIRADASLARQYEMKAWSTVPSTETDTVILRFADNQRWWTANVSRSWSTLCCPRPATAESSVCSETSVALKVVCSPFRFHSGNLRK